MSLGRINLVSVPVSDQDAARRFYVDTLGFTVTFDYVMGADEAGDGGAGARWLMLTPPGGGADITLVTWFGETAPPGSAKLSITCDDVDATYAALRDAGVRPNNAVEDAPWGRWFAVARGGGWGSGREQLAGCRGSIVVSVPAGTSVRDGAGRA